MILFLYSQFFSFALICFSFSKVSVLQPNIKFEVKCGHVWIRGEHWCKGFQGWNLVVTPWHHFQRFHSGQLSILFAFEHSFTHARICWALIYAHVNIRIINTSRATTAHKLEIWLVEGENLGVLHLLCALENNFIPSSPNEFTTSAVFWIAWANTNKSLILKFEQTAVNRQFFISISTTIVAI